MTEDELTRETLAAEKNGDLRRVFELGRLEREGRLDEAEPKYLDGDDPERDLSHRIERAAAINEAAGAESTAEALRRIKGAEDPEKALQKAARRAKNLGREYEAEEFSELLGE